ncbi:MAG: UvrD-helicase domain-containing protein, partial [bacterium]
MDIEEILRDLNPEQKEAVLFNSAPLVIFAGAGSGKTKVITYKAAYLVSQGVSPRNILAVTFTN